MHHNGIHISSLDGAPECGTHTARDSSVPGGIHMVQVCGVPEYGIRTVPVYAAPEYGIRTVPVYAVPEYGIRTVLVYAVPEYGIRTVPVYAALECGIRMAPERRTGGHSSAWGLVQVGSYYCRPACCGSC
ncbi:MAG: hypothetical protein ACLRTM_06930 [Clostridium sp.]